MKRIFCPFILTLVVTLIFGDIRPCTNGQIVLSFLQKEGWSIQSQTYSFDSLSILFSAKSPQDAHNSLYITHITKEGWSTPQQVFKSDDSEAIDPTWSPSQNQLYFIKHTFAIPDNKKSEDKFQICSSSLSNNQWSTPSPIIISEGCESTPFLAEDEQTLFFAKKVSISRNKKLYRLFFTRKVDAYNWVVPTPLVETEDNVEHYAPTISQHNDTILQFLTCVQSKNSTHITEDTMHLLPSYRKLPVLTLWGDVTDYVSHTGIAADITVYDAITSQPLALLHSHPTTGRYRIALQAGRQYIVDITRANYSHQYIQYDASNLSCNKDSNISVVLSPVLSLTVNTYDSELFTPVLNPRKETLEIGKEHQLTFAKENYETTNLYIDTRKQIVFPEAEIDVKMRHGTCPIRLLAEDTAKHVNLDANITLTNLDVNNAKAQVYTPGMEVRQGNKYAIHATLKRYFPFDTILTIHPSKNEYQAVLPLQAMLLSMVVRLKNIQFEFNSALLMPDSYTELDKIIELMKDNDEVHIQLSAHTDNVGNDVYNQKLSQRRGDAVLQYIVAGGISPERITAVGYGKTQPLVPNTSDENRAINRRVEFKITEL